MECLGYLRFQLEKKSFEGMIASKMQSTSWLNEVFSGVELADEQV
jgi:hypothetical protein